MIQINQNIMSMDFIKCKTDWVRQIRPHKALAGCLDSKNSCRSMSSIIQRWNKTEGQERNMFIKYLIDYKAFIIVAWMEPIRKEVCHV